MPAAALPMRTLVTGSSGHLGEGLVRTLRAADGDVVGLDIEESPFTTQVGSVSDPDCVGRCMQGIDVVYHAATLHKPHVATHSKREFVDTNVTGTLTLLEAADAAGVKAFVFTSTTSVFGDAMRPAPGDPAVWVTEALRPVPKNIYGVTKTAAEDLCQLFHRKRELDCIVLRTSRFFPEEDDDQTTRAAFEDGNVKVNEFLFRRVDLEDVVSAHLMAAERAGDIGFGRYIVSATTPFRPADLSGLNSDAAAVVDRRVPGFSECYRRRQWRMFDTIGRVYVNDAARRELHWRPTYDFAHVLNCLERGTDYMSPLARAVGAKGYHDEVFDEGPYPID